MSGRLLSESESRLVLKRVFLRESKSIEVRLPDAGSVVLSGETFAFLIILRLL